MKKREEKKIDPFYNLRKKESNEVKEKVTSNWSMYRFMVNLVFS